MALPPGLQVASRVLSLQQVRADFQHCGQLDQFRLVLVGGAGRTEVRRRRAAWRARVQQRCTDRSRSARVSSGLVNVAFMASPFCQLHCLRCLRVWPSSPRVYPLCRFSPRRVWRPGQMAI